MEEAELRWEGEAPVELKAAAADQVESLLEDFCGIHKWLPDLGTCYQINGEKGRPGLTRYCASTALFQGGHDVSWAKEKLLSVDPLHRCLSYEVVDNNIGIDSYVASMEVSPVDGGGCRIRWYSVSRPIEGCRSEDLVAVMDSRLQFMANKMEELFQHSV